MVSCCVPTCKSVVKKSSDLCFYEIPQDNRALRQKWISAISMECLASGTRLRLRQDSKVCSLHFHQSDFANETTKCLHPDSIPVFFSQCSVESVCKKLDLVNTAGDAIEARTKSSIAPQTVSSKINPKVVMVKMTQNGSEEKKLLEMAKKKPKIKQMINKVNKSSTTIQEVKATQPSLETESIQNKNQENQSYAGKSRLVESSLKAELQTCKRKITYLQSKVFRLTQNAKGARKKILGSNVEKQLQKIEEESKKGDLQASFILNQVTAYGKKKMPSTEATLKACTIWQTKNPQSYNLVRKLGFLMLPHRNTITRFVNSYPLPEGVSLEETPTPSSSGVSQLEEIKKMEEPITQQDPLNTLSQEEASLVEMQCANEVDLFHFGETNQVQILDANQSTDQSHLIKILDSNGEMSYACLVEI